MGKLGKVLDLLCLSSPGSNCSCFCINTLETEDDDIDQRMALIETDAGGEGQLLKLRDVVTAKTQTLAFQLKPKMVVLRVSMHCNGCARKVKKHISKIEGVTSIDVDLESKKVVVIGDITPYEVLESVSKVKTAQLWTTSVLHSSSNKNM
ncbi:hypothetical protein GIB67_035455 [Kingdonia uniflora]|uniref:HMA domain-containing protein n=1 Tax=Kingdonia uniflora TaxID=39325 RepID=A0A7J7P0F9_9MAGN|nr:hypothetical protein GIB67_035455 [Kingdonia uniflora]